MELLKIFKIFKNRNYNKPIVKDLQAIFVSPYNHLALYIYFHTNIMTKIFMKNSRSFIFTVLSSWRFLDDAPFSTNSKKINKQKIKLKKAI